LPDARALARRLLAREREAVAPALNLADDRRPAQRAQAAALLDQLEREAPFPGAPRIGLTGAPGAGKSTLLDALARRLRTRGETVGIVAVDPSSRETGGALLGDRIRVPAAGHDAGIFVRSMAARERLGGLADATRAGVAILAAVFDRIFVETVGVGQSEVEVASLVDTLVYVANPGTGDALQFMKAGVIELPDVFVVNKSDLGAAAQRTAHELEGGLALGVAPEGGWRPPVLLASGRDGGGVAELLAAQEAHFAHLVASGALAARRGRGRESFVLDALERRYGSFGLARLGGRDAARARVRERAQASSFALAEQLGREIEDALRKGE
jgi:LAO/AO transport system kinase